MDASRLRPDATSSTARATSLQRQQSIDAGSPGFMNCSRRIIRFGQEDLRARGDGRASVDMWGTRRNTGSQEKGRQDVDELLQVRRTKLDTALYQNAETLN